MSTATGIAPSTVLPDKLNKVSIQSTAFPGVYLRTDGERPAADGVNNLLNLQVTRQGWERLELIAQDAAVYGPDVYIIRSIKFERYVFLDPTVFPGQEPRAGTTFHPKGVGRSAIVNSIDNASRFKIVVNFSEGEAIPYTVSFKLVGAPAATPNVYLRLNGNESLEFKGPGSGEVNGQTYIGPYEKLLVERFA